MLFTQLNPTERPMILARYEGGHTQTHTQTHTHTHTQTHKHTHQKNSVPMFQRPKYPETTCKGFICAVNQVSALGHVSGRVFMRTGGELHDGKNTAGGRRQIGNFYCVTHKSP